MAAANDALDIASVLIPSLSTVNVTDRAGRTSLHHASFNGHLEVRFRFRWGFNDTSTQMCFIVSAG